MTTLTRLCNNVWRFITGKCFKHSRNMEDMGGVVYEVCDNCNWVGRNFVYEDFTIVSDKNNKVISVGKNNI